MWFSVSRASQWGDVSPHEKAVRRRMVTGSQILPKDRAEKLYAHQPEFLAEFSTYEIRDGVEFVRREIEEETWAMEFGTLEELLALKESIILDGTSITFYDDYVE